MLLANFWSCCCSIGVIVERYVVLLCLLSFYYFVSIIFAVFSLLNSVYCDFLFEFYLFICTRLRFQFLQSLAWIPAHITVQNTHNTCKFRLAQQTKQKLVRICDVHLLCTPKGIRTLDVPYKSERNRNKKMETSFSHQNIHHVNLIYSKADTKMLSTKKREKFSMEIVGLYFVQLFDFSKWHLSCCSYFAWKIHKNHHPTHIHF